MATIPPAEALQEVVGRQTAQWPFDLKPQVFVRPELAVSVKSGEVRFALGDTVNTTVKRLTSAPIIAERVIVMNRSSDDSGTATKGNAILLGDGPNAFGQQIPVNAAVELLNANLGEIVVAYSGTVNLAGAEIVIVGWIAHGLIRTGKKQMTSVEVTERI